ncbi:MAG TPA: hypothetical protein VNO84_16725 [Burkholderiaceae bacterium]|nr:hypothetical protein [Burkholderiaceae bacterium]
MNIALPAFVIFVLLLPGFIFRSGLKRIEREIVDYSPFGRVVVEATLWNLLLHLLWLGASDLLVGEQVRLAWVLSLLSSHAPTQVQAILEVERDTGLVLAYFGSLYLFAYAAPRGLRAAVSRFRLDRVGSRWSRFVRFSEAPWYYLLTGADFAAEDEPDFILVSAIVNVGDQPYIFRGMLEEFFVSREGALDRLVLASVERRPFGPEQDKDTPDEEVFYPIEGDYFVIRASEIVTLNIQYVRFERAGEGGGADGATAARLPAG